MTSSTMARDGDTGGIGIAVATKCFAEGASLPRCRTNTRAGAAQAFENPYYCFRGLELLEAGAGTEGVIARLTVSDPGSYDCQLHMMDRVGRLARTGTACIGWCGHRLSGSLSITTCWPGTPSSPKPSVPMRHEGPSGWSGGISARCGQARPGGDQRGRQSAVLLVHDGEDYPLFDVRADDHAGPLGEPALGAISSGDTEPARTGGTGPTPVRGVGLAVDRGGL